MDIAACPLSSRDGDMLDGQEPHPMDAKRQQRNLAAAKLIQMWLDDNSGYDEEVWPIIEAELRSQTLQIPEKLQ